MVFWISMRMPAKNNVYSGVTILEWKKFSGRFSETFRGQQFFCEKEVKLYNALQLYVSDDNTPRIARCPYTLRRKFKLFSSIIHEMFLAPIFFSDLKYK
jgi:hypothetical protein